MPWRSATSGRQKAQRCDDIAGLYVWLRELDLNQRPSGYEPDELPGCSTPRLYGLAAPCVHFPWVVRGERGWELGPRVIPGVFWMGWKTWRRPTLPCLRTQYHGRWGFSRPSSGWDRVQAPRDNHQVVQPIQLSVLRCQFVRRTEPDGLGVGVLVLCCAPRDLCVATGDDFHAWCVGWSVGRSFLTTDN